MTMATHLQVSYVACTVVSLEGHFRDTSLQLCHGQNWQVHSCPFDEDRGQVIANIVSGQCVMDSITVFFSFGKLTIQRPSNFVVFS